MWQTTVDPAGLLPKKAKGALHRKIWCAPTEYVRHYSTMRLTSARLVMAAKSSYWHDLISEARDLRSKNNKSDFLVSSSQGDNWVRAFCLMILTSPVVILPLALISLRKFALVTG